MNEESLELPKLPEFNPILVDEPIIVAFTDGSCYPNNKSADSKAGYSVIFVSGCLKGEFLCGKLKCDKYYASNIRAECVAIILALKKIKEKEIIDKWNTCKIFTDSKFWIDMISKYIPNWVRRRQNIKDKKNFDLIIKLLKLLHFLSSNNKKVRFVHVFAHNKNGWKNSRNKYKQFCYINNKCADELANYARLS